MNLIRSQAIFLKLTLALIPLLYFPYCEDPFRSFRETIFQIAVIGVSLFFICRILLAEITIAQIKSELRKDRLLFYLFSLFGFSSAALWFSTLFNGMGSIAVYTSVNYMLGGVLFLAFYFFVTAQNSERWIRILLAAVFINAVMAILQFFDIAPLFVSTDPDFHARYRQYMVAGFMDSPNMLAPLLACMVPFLFTKWMLSAEGRSFLKYGGGIMFLLFVVVVSRNMGGFAGLFVAGVIMSLFYLARGWIAERRLLLRALFCVGAVFLATVISIVIYTKADSQTKTIKKWSLHERKTQNVAALMMFADSPLVGKGPGSFYRHFVDYRRKVWFTDPPPIRPGRTAHQVHNDYVQLLGEGGLLFALPVAGIIIMFMYLHMSHLLRIVSMPVLMPHHSVFIASAGGFWVIAVNALVNFPFHIAPLAVCALFWAAVSLRMLQYPENDEA